MLFGDPAKEGMFAVRIRAPKDYRIPPHTHSKPELLTVISGKFGLGMGPAADRAAVESLPAGSFSSMPAGVVHYVFVDEEVRSFRSTRSGLGTSITSTQGAILV